MWDLPGALSVVLLVVDSPVPGLWDATKGCSAYTAPEVPPVSPQKTSDTLTQKSQTAKGLMKEKARMLRGRIIFSIAFFGARNIPQ